MKSLVVDTSVAINWYVPQTYTPYDLLEDAYAIAIQHNRSVYDSLYIALAQRENTTFITADEKLFNTVSGSLPVILLAQWM